MLEFKKAIPAAMSMMITVAMGNEVIVNSSDIHVFLLRLCAYLVFWG